MALRNFLRDRQQQHKHRQKTASTRHVEQIQNANGIKTTASSVRNKVTVKSYSSQKNGIFNMLRMESELTLEQAKSKQREKQ